MQSMMTNPALAKQPWPIYAGLRDHAPAMEVPFSRSRSGNVVILSRYEDVHRALREPELFAACSDGHPANNMGQKRPTIPLDTDPPRHAKYRKLLEPLFSPRAAQALGDTARSIAQELLAAVADTGQADLHAAFTVPFPCRVFLHLVGFPPEDLQQFLRWKDALIHAEIVAGTDDSATIAKLMSDTADAVYDYFGQLLDRRAAQPCDDLATRLVEATIDGEALSRNEMLDMLFLQMAAGLDTVTASLDCVFTRLAEDPALQERARTDLEQRRLIIEELLRVESPVSMVFRYATQDVDLHGTTIKQGDMVMMLLGAANTDERAFADPLAVDPGRDNTRHMVFGGGIHRCMGSHLARLEIGVALEELFAALGTFEVAPGKEVGFMPGIRTATTLPVQWASAASVAGGVR